MDSRFLESILLVCHDFLLATTDKLDHPLLSIRRLVFQVMEYFRTNKLATLKNDADVVKFPQYSSLWKMEPAESTLRLALSVLRKSQNLTECIQFYQIHGVKGRLQDYFSLSTLARAYLHSNQVLVSLKIFDKLLLLPGDPTSAKLTARYSFIYNLVKIILEKSLKNSINNALILTINTG